jgi:hypothetical protein
MNHSQGPCRWYYGEEKRDALVASAKRNNDGNVAAVHRLKCLPDVEKHAYDDRFV